MSKQRIIGNVFIIIAVIQALFFYFNINAFIAYYNQIVLISVELVIFSILLIVGIIKIRKGVKNGEKPIITFIPYNLQIGIIVIGILTTLLIFNLKKNGDDFIGNWKNADGKTLVIKKVAEKYYNVKLVNTETIFGNKTSTGFGDAEYKDGVLIIANGLSKVIKSNGTLILDGISYNKE